MRKVLACAGLLMAVLLVLQGMLGLAVLGQDAARLPAGVDLVPQPATGDRPQGDPVEARPHPILSDVRVRQAIAYCTDKDALIAAAYPELSKEEREALVMDTFVPRGHWAYSEPTMTYPFSTTLGINLLTEAGWTLPQGAEYVEKGGKRLALTVKSSDSEMRMAFLPVFEMQMKACGMQVKHHPQSTSAFFNDQGTISLRDFSLAEYAWSGFGEAPGIAGRFGCDAIPTPANNWDGQNYMGWCNQAASDAAELGDDESLSRQERRAHIAAFIDLLAEDMPTLLLFMREGGSPYSFASEHIDFNLETFSQEAEVPVDRETVLEYTDFSGNEGTITVPPGAVEERITLSYTPMYETGDPLPGIMQVVKAYRMEATIGGILQEAYTFEEATRVVVGYQEWEVEEVFEEEAVGLYYYDGIGWQEAYESCPEEDRYQHLDVESNYYEANVCVTEAFTLMGRGQKVYLPLVVGGSGR